MPLVAGQAEHQPLAEAGAGYRHPQSDARAHLQTPGAGNLVQVEDFRVLKNAQMNRIAGAPGQRLDMRTRHGDQRPLFKRLHPEMDQLGTEQVALVGHMKQIPFRHQTVEHPVGRAAGRSQAGRDAFDVSNSFGDAFQQGKASQQRLRTASLALLPLVRVRLVQHARLVARHLGDPLSHTLVFIVETALGCVK